MAADDNARPLEHLFAHRHQPEFRHRHDRTPGDVPACDNIRTLHRAVADYGRGEHRPMRRCQVMADKVFATPA